MMSCSDSSGGAGRGIFALGIGVLIAIVGSESKSIEGVPSRFDDIC